MPELQRATVQYEFLRNGGELAPHEALRGRQDGQEQVCHSLKQAFRHQVLGSTAYCMPERPSTPPVVGHHAVAQVPYEHDTADLEALRVRRNSSRWYKALKKYGHLPETV